MKLTNTSPWRAGPIKSIILRLGNRLGRVLPKHLDIRLCCTEGKCGHWPYPAPAYNRDDSTRIMTLYLPRTFEFSARDVAYMVDLSMKGQRENIVSEGIRRRVFTVRNYGWADERHPMQRIPARPPRQRPTKPKPTKAQKLQARRKQVEGLIKRWKRKQTAVRSTLAKYEAEKKRLTRQIQKEEAPDA